MITGLSPSKRKLPLPGEAPVLSEKRPRVGSPTKLNRIPITPAKTNKSTVVAASASTGTTPLRTYGSSRSFRTSNSKSGPLSQPDANEALQSHSGSVKNSVRENEPPMQLGNERIVADSTPTTPTKRTTARTNSLLEDTSPRPSTSHNEISEAVTPTPRRTTRAAATSLANSDQLVRKGARSTKSSPLKAKVDAQEAEPTSSTKEEFIKSCRHHIPPFADRRFYLYKDPRKQREWEVCEKNMQAMMHMYGHPFAEVST